MRGMGRRRRARIRRRVLGMVEAAGRATIDGRLAELLGAKPRRRGKPRRRSARNAEDLCG